MAGHLFSNDSDGVTGTWLNAPELWRLVANIGLKVSMDGGSDFWRKTYYQPCLVKDNGHFLYMKLPDKHVIDTEFDLTAVEQFDQAGIVIRYSDTCWLKAGLEYVDGKCKLGCVVTNGHSDWSTQEFANSSLAIRVFRQGNDFVVRYRKDDQTWDMIRVCHLQFCAEDDIMGGVYACSPTKAGGSVIFKRAQVCSREPWDE